MDRRLSATLDSSSAQQMLIRHLLRPLDTTSLILLAVFTAGFTFGLQAGFYGGVVILLLLSWFFKYAYVLLDSVANGVKETPVLSTEMLNPVDEQRPAAQAIIVIGLYMLAKWLGGWLGVLVAVLGGLYLPISVAVLGTSSRAIDAVNPVVLTRVLIGLGSYYFVILGVIAFYVIVMFLAAGSSLPYSLKTGLGLFFVLSLFSLLGGALYERRHRLGLDPTHSPERTAERENRERARIRARTLDEVYGEARSGNFLAARESLTRWLREESVDYLERDALFFMSQAREWQDEKAFVFISRFLISHLIETGKTGAAVETAAGVLARAPTLKLGTATDTLKLASLARAAGKRSLALRLVAEFERQFPGDAHMDEALALRREVER
ncbi:MAG: hypothetical protein ABI885_26025 [Gammaproteobacteria bacterium]